MTHYRMIARLRPSERVYGAPLVNAARKSQPHVKGWATRYADRTLRRIAHLATFGPYQRGPFA